MGQLETKLALCLWWGKFLRGEDGIKRLEKSFETYNLKGENPLWKLKENCFLWWKLKLQFTLEKLKQLIKKSFEWSKKSFHPSITTRNSHHHKRNRVNWIVRYSYFSISPGEERRKALEKPSQIHLFLTFRVSKCKRKERKITNKIVSSNIISFRIEFLID